MKRCFFISLCAFLLLNSVKGQEPVKFNELFNAGKYPEAAAEIDRLISEKGSAAPNDWYYYQAEAWFQLFSTTGKITLDHLYKAQVAMLTYLNHYKTYQKLTEIKSPEQLAGSIARECYKSGAQEYNNENYTKAQQDFTRAVQLFDIVKNFSDLQKLYYHLAMTCKYNNDTDNAMLYLQKLIDTNYKDENVFMLLAEMHKNRGNFAEAEKILKQANQISGSTETYYELIYLLMDLKKTDEAMQYIQLFNAQNRYDSGISMAEGNIYYMQNNTDSALTVFKKVVLQEPDHFSANYNAGIILYNRGMKIMKEAEEKYYDQPEIYRNRKDLYLKDIIAAIPYLEKAHALNKEDMNIMLCLSDIYKRLQRNSEYESMQEGLKKMKQ